MHFIINIFLERSGCLTVEKRLRIVLSSFRIKCSLPIHQNYLFMTDKEKDRFELTPFLPVPSFHPACNRCNLCRHVLRLPNVLYSPQSKWVLVWLPKCACSTARWLFLQWQRIVNPWAFQLTHIGISLHEIHLKKSFQFGFHFPDYAIEHPESTRILIITRHPLRRFLSCYVQKQIMHKDIKFLATANVYRLRMYFDAHNIRLTMRTLLGYMVEYGCLDIHDTPVTCMIPSTFLAPSARPQDAHVTVLDSDDAQFTSHLEHFCQDLPWFETNPRRTFHEFQQLFDEIPHLNPSPFCANAPNQLPKQSFWDWTVEEWRSLVLGKQLPSPSWFMREWAAKADPSLCHCFQQIYGADMRLFQSIRVRAPSRENYGSRTRHVA